MKKRTLLSFLLAILFTFTLSSKQSVEANVSNIPYETYSYGLKGELVSTATAYEGTFILNAGFKNPQDIFIDSNEVDGKITDTVYVADTDNKRIYRYNIATKVTSTIGTGILESPTGVYVDRYQDIYVADSKLNQVFWFNQDGELQKVYNRPDEALFGDDAPYQPRKVIVDARKNVYVITEGGSNGIIQMDVNGDFLGYYGVNTVQLDFSLYVKRLLMSKEQKDKYASLTPKATTNFAIDQKGLIYTVIENEYANPIKKLNIEGNNVLTGRLLEDPFYKDIYVDKDGLIYTISNNDDSEAIISVHDAQGNLIFVFGEKNPGSLKMGEFDSPSGIATDSNGDIWVLDAAGGNVQVFTKTEFANMVLNAIKLYNNSEYDEAKELFTEVVRQNAMFSLAHSSLGKAYQRNHDYELALNSYKIANDKVGYSEVFWELRDIWIAKNLITVIVLLVLLFVGTKLFGRHKQKIKGYEKLIQKSNQLKETNLFKELKFLTHILKDPNDVVYEIKFRQSVRIRTAGIIYVIFILLNIISDFYIKGYLFRGMTDDVVLSFEVMKWFLPLILFGVANHLMNSLQSGEAFYRDIFIGMIYALSPILLFKLPLDLLSNVLTYNEAFIYQLGYLIMYGWAILNVILVIKELNNYKPGQLIINLVLTIFTMLIMIILYLVINVLTNQLLSFIQGILQEVF